jgi:hypothetical protein
VTIRKRERLIEELLDRAGEPTGSPISLQPMMSSQTESIETKGLMKQVWAKCTGGQIPNISSEHNKEIELMQQLHEAQQQNAKLVEKNARLKQRVVEQEGHIARAQVEVFRTNNEAAWIMEPDSVIGGKLNSIERMTRTFCKEYAVMFGDRRLLETLAMTQPTALGWALGDGCLMELFQNPQYQKCAFPMLLSAWISVLVTKHIFNDPFSFVADLLYPGEYQHDKGRLAVLKDFLRLVDTSKLLAER